MFKKRDVAYSIVYLRLVEFNTFLGKLGRDGGLLNFLVQNWSKKSGPERGAYWTVGVSRIFFCGGALIRSNATQCRPGLKFEKTTILKLTQTSRLSTEGFAISLGRR